DRVQSRADSVIELSPSRTDEPSRTRTRARTAALRARDGARRAEYRRSWSATTTPRSRTGRRTRWPRDCLPRGRCPRSSTPAATRPGCSSCTGASAGCTASSPSWCDLDPRARGVGAGLELAELLRQRRLARAERGDVLAVGQALDAHVTRRVVGVEVARVEARVDDAGPLAPVRVD